MILVVYACSNLCIIFDKHVGLLQCCKDMFLLTTHHHYLRHVHENLKQAIKKMKIRDIKFLCQKICMVDNTDDLCIFNHYMINIKNVKPKTHKWLLNCDVMKWSLAHDGGMHYKSMTTNMYECFNVVLKCTRDFVNNLGTNLYSLLKHHFNIYQMIKNCYLMGKFQLIHVHAIDTKSY